MQDYSISGLFSIYAFITVISGIFLFILCSLLVTDICDI